MRVDLRFLSLILLAKAGSVEGQTTGPIVPYTTECLKTHSKYVKPADRKQAIIGNGTKGNLKFSIAGWISAEILSHLAGIILEERVGVEVEMASVLSSSQKIYLSIAGCKDWDATKFCDTDISPLKQSQLTVELWQSYISGMPEKVASEAPKSIPVCPGDIGAEGTEGIFLRGSIVEKATSDGVYVDWYKAYDLSSSNKAYKYFDDHTNVTAPEQKCDTLYSLIGTYLTEYISMTGDTNTSEMKSGKRVKKCWDGGWALTPACRTLQASGVSGCIPTVTYNGYGFHIFTQLAYWHNMPLALGAFSYGKYITFAKQYGVLHYWWTPDGSFVSQRPNEMILPQYNSDEYLNKIYKTAIGGAKLLKCSSAPLADNVPVQLMLQAFEISIQSLMGIITTAIMSADGGKTKSENQKVACNWLKNNPTVAESWVPDPTSCVLKQGLVNASGNFVQNKSLATSCEFCPIGRFSKVMYLSTGRNYICEECISGRFQGGLGATGCDDCPKGYFAYKNGTTVCSKCPVGTYAENKASRLCTTCGPKLTTADSATMDSYECVCETGYYRDLANNCLPCPPGMECTTGSFKGNLTLYSKGLIPKGQPGANSQRPSEHSPAVKQGFYTTASEPLSVYECIPPEVCPGGIIPATCAGQRIDFVCTKCPKDHVAIGDLEDEEAVDPTGCEKCSESRLIYLIFVPVACLFALFFILFETRKSPLHDGPIQAEIQQLSGQLVMFLQIMGAMGAASMKYGEPFTSFVNALTGPIELDEFFIGTPCLSYGFVQADVAFAAQVMLPALFVFALCITFFAGITIKKGLFNGNGLLNAIGEVMIEFYVSITIAIMAPFKCYKHPNDKTSMVFSPEVLCGTGTHAIMMTTAFVGMLMYPINCFCTTCIATYYHPRAMSKNDIGMLIRCHFLFNRWTPPKYWFSVVAVTRNFFVALWPMVIPEENMDFAVTLMIGTLLTAFLLTAWVKPRRTPAMNRLDMWISFVQLMILAVGGMSVYAGLQTHALGVVLVICVCSVFATAFIIFFVKALQFISKGRSPGSWSFDVFIDFHGGAGAMGARGMHLVLSSHVKKGKVFYDYDSQLQQGFLGVITDAVKLSCNCICVLGSETSCRSWCVAALCGALQRHVPVINVTIEGAPFELVVTDPRVVNILSIQAPKELLRPVGINDELVPEVLNEVLKIAPMNFVMANFDEAKTFFDQLLQITVRIRVQSGSPAPQDILAQYHSKASLPKTGSQWYGDTQEYAMISCDQEDSEAVAASRVVYALLRSSLVDWKTHGHKLAGADPRALMVPGAASFDWKGEFIQDVDLEPAEFDDLIVNKRIAVLVVLLTPGSLSSLSQLLRLGHAHKFMNPFPQTVPIAINDAFGMPGKKLMDDIESGTRFEASGGVANAAITYTTKEVSMARVITSVMECLESTISLLDVARIDPGMLRGVSNKIILRVVSAAYTFRNAKPMADDETTKASIFATVCAKSVKSRLSTMLGYDPNADAGAGEAPPLEEVSV